MNAATPVRWLYPSDKKPAARHPAPEVVNRPAADGEVPRGARAIEQLATRHDWTVRVTYARGTKPGRNPVVVDSIALRLCRGEAWAWAVWLDGKFDAAQVLRPGDIARSVTATVLRAELTRESVA